MAITWILDIIFIVLALVDIGIHGFGTSLTIDDDDIIHAIETNSLSDLFKELVESYPVVMFTSSECSLSDGAKKLMNKQFPEYSYLYYDFDTEPFGKQFIMQSARTVNSMKLPQIWICGQYIGGFKELKEMVVDDSLLGPLKDCSKFKLVEV